MFDVTVSIPKEPKLSPTKANTNKNYSMSVSKILSHSIKCCTFANVVLTLH